ncbi:hypothetical protein BDF20DRAFT_811489 [Mycotypha africana]|uniref:uncharacterized protein n=1 Tax=Mycotypha africana TaxID=64632 RepID=UPI0023008AE5|nr:uncharacterized protein BDF20DRAFT_811489 [Mycotypha africana]KAI8991830.1 hypothetical protein BDF20DRAFT_811489 [Mycotypha africana]
MAHKPNSRKQNQIRKSKSKEKKPSPHDDIESLQVTFYEIESWIEKTTPVLNRLTKELDKASTNFAKTRKEFEDKEQQQQQQQQQQADNDQEALAIVTSAITTSNAKPMQWLLSFQPGNLLRLDTNITSVEQLIEAVRMIRSMQSEETTTRSSSSILTNYQTTQDAYVEYWQYAIGRRPKICLENYKHCRMNLNGLTKNITPVALNYIGQVYMDCLHPKFCSDWNTFWDKSGKNPQRDQACIDSGLGMLFLHIMRHDKFICENSQEIAGFYYDRAREELMDFFDEQPDCASIEALLNLSMFCIVCKRYSQAKIYIGLCLDMVINCNLHKEAKMPHNEIFLRRKYLKLLLILYYNDSTLSVYVNEPALIRDEDLNVDFYELITLNNMISELHSTEDNIDKVDFDNNKTLVKETYFVHTVELCRLTKKTTILVENNASLRQLVAQERLLLQWFERLPQSFRKDSFNYDKYERMKQRRAEERDLISSMDAEALEAQAALLLRIQYEAQWIILQKAIINCIRHSSQSSFTLLPFLKNQEQKSIAQSTSSAETIVSISEKITRCFGWCVCQQLIPSLYHASTVFCGQALRTNDVCLRNKATAMIHRIMNVLGAGSLIYEGFPDDMSECLCEFLKEHGIHNSMECLCMLSDDNTELLKSTDKMEEDNTIIKYDNSNTPFSFS